MTIRTSYTERDKLTIANEALSASPGSRETQSYTYISNIFIYNNLMSHGGPRMIPAMAADTSGEPRNIGSSDARVRHPGRGGSGGVQSQREGRSVPRYRLRTLMIAVVVAGLLLGLIRSVRVHVDRSGGGAIAMAVSLDLMSIVLAAASLAALLFLLHRKPRH
jgi:hypothetical protein